ncbi:putative potassium transporter 17-like protein [Trifolium pratense]|uniref:Putative potassium transporter 17-like protein n=1 Tax=Trifolium pratense TaxID=57577 RepID=A0A2K3PE73_TRIPR|nr:putative potassium transporter 17-like protein [Trifolium pratense]
MSSMEETHHHHSSSFSNDVVLNLPDSQPQGKKKKDTLVLAYKTLGVVFGGLVTSPLYVYPSMPLNSPTEQDYLGIYSIMFWTLTLIGLVKYANIAIRADDHGEESYAFLFSASIVFLAH